MLCNGKDVITGEVASLSLEPSKKLESELGEDDSVELLAAAAPQLRNSVFVLKVCDCVSKYTP